MNRRSAVTLIEVLVSIFIMGIGLLALLTLFPLGALTMDQAIQADRAAACARIAYSIVQAKNIRHDTTYFDPMPAAPATPVDVFADPNPNPPANPPAWPVLNKLPGGDEGPSYSIFVDPHGILGGSPQTIGALALPTLNSPGIPRRGVSIVQNFKDSLLWFSLPDDMDFNDDGVPKVLGAAIQRTNRYTWALMLRRPRVSDTSWVEMAVVVYGGRPLQTVSDEQAYGPVNFDPNSNEVRVSWDTATQDKPPIRKGGWILDATVMNQAGQASPRGFFYRVANVTDVTSTTPGRQEIVLELETRPRVASNPGVLVIMERVIQVFDEGLGWKP